MTDILKQYALPIVLSLIAGVSGYFQGTGAAKEAAASKIENRVTEVEKVNAVQDEKIVTSKGDIAEIKKDVKEILKTLRPDDYRPAVLDTSIPKIKGVAKDGSPLNAHD